jgi:multiple sugar transport system ATP-binding protein
MNLIQARMERDLTGKPSLRIGKQSIPIPERWFSEVEKGRQNVIFGIRPEDMFLPGSVPSYASAAGLQMEVLAVEPLGAETVLILKIDEIDQKVTARVGRDVGIRRGERIEVQLDLGSAILFDPETSQVIEDR